jgi:hypothetical protein
MVTVLLVLVLVGGFLYGLANRARQWRNLERMLSSESREESVEES